MSQSQTACVGAWPRPSGTAARWLAQRLLGLLAVGDVGAGPEPFDDVAAAVPDRHPARLEPAVLPVAAGGRGIPRRRARAPPRTPVQNCRVGSRSSGCSVSSHRQPSSSALGDAGVLRPLRAEVVAGAVRRRGPDQLRQRLGQAPPPLLALPQRLLGPLALGDVAVVGDDPGDARVVQEVLADGLDVPPRAVGVPQAELGRDRGPGPAQDRVEERPLGVPGRRGGRSGRGRRSGRSGPPAGTPADVRSTGTDRGPCPRRRRG